MLRCPGLPESILPYLSPAAKKLFLGSRVKKPEGVKLKSDYVWQYGRIELNDWMTDPDVGIAGIEKKLRSHGVGKIVPPVKALKSRTASCRDYILRGECERLVEEHLDLEAKVDAVFRRARKAVRIPNIPALLDKWAKRMSPRSWEDELQSIIGKSVAAIEGDISQWAEEEVDQ